MREACGHGSESGAHVGARALHHLARLRPLHLFDHAHQLVQARREDTLGLIHNEDGLANAAELELDLELGGSREGEDTDHTGHLIGL